MKSNLTLTKKDITVVLVCALFLLTNLGAIGARGNEHAKRILCASRLQKWGEAIFMHSADNGSLMFVPRRSWWSWPGPNPPCNRVGVAYPHYMGQLYEYDIQQCGRTPTGAMPGEWNVFEINPYIGAFSETYDPPIDCQANELVACPSTSEDFMTEWVTDNCEWGWGFLEPSYSYWVIGGMDPPIAAGDESGHYILKDLTVDTLSPERLVMSDILAIDEVGGVGNPYRYNHGINGWSWFAGHTVGHEDNDPFPKATGRNQLFGDGHIEWRAIPPEYENNLPNTNDVGFQEDRWNGPGSGWMNPGDTSYY